MAPVQRFDRSITVTTAIVTVIVSAGAAWAISTLGDLDPAEHGPLPGVPAWSVTIGVLVLQGAVLAALRRAPRLALIAVAALPIVIALAAPSALFSASALPVLVASFAAALVTSFRGIAGAAGAAAAIVALGQFLDGVGIGRVDLPLLALESAGQGIIVVGIPLVLGSAIAANRAAARAKQDALDAVLREREAQVGEAIALERSAMARELHDIAAHHLSGISLMASAVARQVATDPDAARTGALQIREQSNAVLDDLRSLVGLLREAEDRDGRDGTGGSLKTLATVGDLVATARQTGARVDLDLRPGPSGTLGAGIPPLAQLAAYRMVQESLTNAARHAPGSTATVTIDDRGASELIVVVENDGGSGSGSHPGQPGGFGLVGMRERAALIGGSFDAGPTPEGGWETRMRIPRDLARSARSSQEDRP